MSARRFYRDEGDLERQPRVHSTWFLGGYLVLSGLLMAPSATANCPGANSPQAILDCALNQHPRVKQAQARAAYGNALEGVAAQRPNPELEAKSVIGSSQGSGVVNHDITLSHTFELGGKRGSRIQKALAEKEGITADVLKAKEEVAITLVTSLFRLRQLKTEIETLDEALHTFAQIKEQLMSRPKLTPEQRVSFSIFKLAESDYELRRTSLEAKVQSLEKWVSLAIDEPFTARKELLPPSKQKWPDLIEISSESGMGLSGSEIRKLRAESQSAQADLSLAQSEAWPNLKVGPNVQSQTQGGISYAAYGLNLSLPLPLYQANGGGKKLAELGVQRADTALSQGNDQLVNERNREVIQYQAAIHALKNASTLREVEQEHQKVEDLFQAGLIPSSLVIEAHRQIVDLTQNLHEQELAAIGALWRVYAIEGRVLLEKI